MLRTALIPALILLVTPALAADEAEQVRCAETAFSQSAETRDWEAFESFIHPEARFINGAEPAKVGPAAVRAVWEPNYSRPEISIRWRSRSVEILEPGHLALSRGPYRVRVETEEGTNENWGTFNSIWIRTDEGWRVLYDMGSEGNAEGDEALIEGGGAPCPS